MNSPHSAGSSSAALGGHHHNSFSITSRLATLERQLWKAIVGLLATLGKPPTPTRFDLRDEGTVQVFCWSVLCDRPPSWAYHQRLGPIHLCKGPPPSPVTLSRRLRSPSVVALPGALERLVMQKSWQARDEIAPLLARRAPFAAARLVRSASGTRFDRTAAGPRRPARWPPTRQSRSSCTRPAESPDRSSRRSRRSTSGTAPGPGP